MVATPAPAQRAVTLNGLAYLFVVYVAWSSTYLAIRIGVQEGSGFPPFIMAGCRFLAAGGVLLAWSALARKRLRITRQELPILVVSGLCLMLGGNGLVTWAEQHAHSGYAALVVGCTP